MIISRGWDAKSVLWCVGPNDADDLTSLDIQHAVLLGSACFFSMRMLMRLRTTLCSISYIEALVKSLQGGGYGIHQRILPTSIFFM